jgi:hypothetical protein
MRAFFWLVLTLSLTLAFLAEVRVNAAPEDEKGAAQADDSIDPTTLFPLAKRNGLVIQAVKTESPLNKNITNVNFEASFAGGRKTLEKVVAHPENATAIQLAVAAATMYRAGDLEEAGFLFNAARLRLSHDLDKYEPKNTGSTSTDWFVSVLFDKLAQDVITSLSLDPKVMSKVVKRIESFDLKEPQGYNPGWDYTPHTMPDDVFAKNRAKLLANIKPTSELLLVPEYFDAFREYRQCNALLTADILKDGKGLPDVTKRRDKAAETMRLIENKKGLRGLMFQVDQASPVD